MTEMVWWCGAFQHEPPGFRCTREAGHDGAHAAEIDGEVVATWNRKRWRFGMLTLTADLVLARRDIESWARMHQRTDDDSDKAVWQALVTIDRAISVLSERDQPPSSVATSPPDTGSPEVTVYVAHLVADHWRRSILYADIGEMPWRLAAHPLCCVLAALEGETNPYELGVGPGPDADAIREATHG